MRSASATLAATLALLLPAGAARAFPTGTQFDADPLASAGGGGVHFTASPRFAAATCATCHTDGPRQLGVRLEADDAALFQAGYTPGAVYRLRVALLHESRGTGRNGDPRCGNLPDVFIPCNCNGFALEADDAFGQVAGALCPSPFDQGGGRACARARGAPTTLAMDGTAIHSAGYLEQDPARGLPAGFDNGVTAWDFYWRAPPSGTGPVTFHIGGVDGNGGEGTSEVPEDLTGDDTVEAHLSVGEAGAAPLVASAGCAIGRTAAAGAALGVTLLGALSLALASGLRRRHRRHDHHDSSRPAA